ncbi:MAG: FecR family protein [Saprospiraceae bacterium]
MDYISDIDEIIAKHLAGEIGLEDQVWLDKWLSESADNLLYFKQMQHLWQQAEIGRHTLPRAVDVEAALLRTHHKIQHMPGKTKVVRMAFWQYGVAATFLLLLGAFWFFQPTKDASSMQLASTENTLRETLSDGSIVAINQNSSISARFTKNSRQLKMKGEAYFEVAHNASKPFTVEVQEVLVTVVGTKFNIDNRSDPDWVIISVEEGKVRVQSDTQTEFLIAGEQARINCKNRKMEKLQTSPSGNESAWANRQFTFDDVALSEVIPLLEKAYQVKITLTNKDLGDCRLHARFNDKSIERIVSIIAETFSLEVKYQNEQYFLDGNGCGH